MLPRTPRTFVGSTTFTIRGLGCQHRREAVTEAIVAIAGVTSVTLHLGTDAITVAVSQPVDRADITAAVEQVGYTVVT